MRFTYIYNAFPNVIFYSEMLDNQGLSFGAISGFGPNGAVIHYKSSDDTNVAITNQNTFLFDSGSQYL